MLLNKYLLFVIYCLMFQATLLAQTNENRKQKEAKIQEENARIAAWLQGEPGIYEVHSSDEEEIKLLKQRVNIARRELKIFQEKRHESWGSDPMQFIVGLHARVLETELDLFKKPEQIMSALDESLQRARQLESETRSKWSEGKLPTEDLLRIVSFRLDIELRLLRVRNEQ